MPRVTVKANQGSRSDQARSAKQVHAAVRQALAVSSTDRVLVVYGRNTANIYYEGPNGPLPTPEDGPT